MHEHRSDFLQDFISRLAEGDPGAIFFALFIAFATVAGTLFMVRMVRRQGEQLAEEIGDCSFVFSPEGKLGKPVWRISGSRRGTRFELEARKVAKGDYRTTFRIAVPPGVTWAELRPHLAVFEELLAMGKHGQSPGWIVSEYPGVGGDPAFIQGVIDGVARGIRARETFASSRPE